MPAQGWSVYLLKCADGTFYCGITSNIQKRLAQHNGELPGGARYTRGRRPVTMEAAIMCPDKSSALKLELFVKSLPRSKKTLFFHAQCPALS